MYYIVYKTTNIINGMIYIGVHKTSKLNDGYKGSGILLRKAFKKYGKEKFITEILFQCDDADSMYDMESKLVNEDFIKRKDTYNTYPGGRGGPKDPKETDYYKSGEHLRNMNNAQKKAVESHFKLKQQRISEYNKNPNICGCCISPLPYNKKRNKFCSSSCSAKVSNTNRVVSEQHRQKLSTTLRNKKLNKN